MAGLKAGSRRFSVGIGIVGEPSTDVRGFGGIEVGLYALNCSLGVSPSIEPPLPCDQVCGFNPNEFSSNRNPFGCSNGTALTKERATRPVVEQDNWRQTAVDTKRVVGQPEV